MIQFAQRRKMAISILVVMTALLFWAHSWMTQSLISHSVSTGFLLITFVFFLTFLNLRKRVSFLPVLRTSTWLQIHIYVGWFSVAMFLVHTGFRWPKGAMEITLAVIFWLVALSGVFGIFISRLFPKKMTDRGGHFSYDQIPQYKRALRRRAEELAVNSIEQFKKSTIADFYVERIEPYFLTSRSHIFNHVFGSTKHIDTIFTRMHGLRRYLNDEEEKVLTELEEIVRDMDNLEYQQSLQFVLRTWLFVHIPLSYSMVIFAVFHAVLALRFVSGS